MGSCEKELLHNSCESCAPAHDLNKIMTHMGLYCGHLATSYSNIAARIVVVMD